MPLPQKSGGGGGTSGAWSEISTATLAVNGLSLTTPTFTALPRLYVLIHSYGFDVADELDAQYNGDAAVNYSQRYSVDFGGSNDVTSVNKIFLSASLSVVYPMFVTMDIMNIATLEKYAICFSFTSQPGAANTCRQRAAWSKWVNTTNQITSIKIFGGAGKNLLAGTNIKVYGAS